MANAVLLERLSIMGVTNVTVQNLTINCGASTNAFDIGGNSSGIKVINVKLTGIPSHGALVRNAKDVTIDTLVADWVDTYLVYCDNTDGITVKGCTLTGGSKNETGVRFMENVTNVSLINNTITNTGWKETALRCHGGGSNVAVIGGTYNGQTAFGPMGEGDGGENEADPVKRKTLLGYRLNGVHITGTTFNGGLFLCAGLEACTFTDCKINGVKSTQNVSGCPVSKLTTTYPDAAHLKGGDVARGYPQVAFTDCTFTTPSKFNCYGNTDGNFSYESCTRNGAGLDNQPVKQNVCKCCGQTIGQIIGVK